MFGEYYLAYKAFFRDGRVIEGNWAFRHSNAKTRGATVMSHIKSNIKESVERAYGKDTLTTIEPIVVTMLTQVSTNG